MLGRSRALDHLRRRKIIGFVGLSEVRDLPDDSKTLEETVLADQRKRTVNAALEKLPAEMAAAVHLVYFEEMTYAQAAKVMKKSPKQVDNLLYRAKKELRIILGEDGEQLL
jgi:RNA polymerase sigma-70 factor (ECF subfamily)